MDYKQEADFWRKNVGDTALKEELENLMKDDKALEDRFYKHLEFGTGGLRGILGVGSNCMNVYTVARATEGVAAYMRKKSLGSAAISYDSRIHSDTFAKTAACVLASEGIKVYFVKELMPTPFLSYITREYQCGMGIMITASHNPAVYNGYKVYNSDGCQITDAAAVEVSEEIGKCSYFAQTYKPFEDYVQSGAIVFCGDEKEDEYLAKIKALSTGGVSGLRVTYSALNGTGYRIVPRLLREDGIGELKLVEEQCVPDGRFPTCPYPNPEKKEALALGLKQAKENKSDLLLATDPDADRVGIAVRNGEDYVLLTGNEVGVLLTDYLFSVRKSAGTLPADPIVIKTIVTTGLADKIVAEYGGRVINVLTGFKYIGEQIGRLEQSGKAGDFVLGFEESYGYLIGTNVRDKDAVVASQVICEMTAYYKAQGKTLVEVLDGIYKKYGRYEHRLFTYEFAGFDGSRRMKELLKNLREQGLADVCSRKVVGVKDYLDNSGSFLPKANVLSYVLEDGTSFIVRPSGTEPLIKVYLTVCKTKEENQKTEAEIGAFLQELFR